jgi:isocitrate/isopropylmalate dehydrogenase
VGGNFKKGTPDEVAINEDLNTRKGVERVIRAAFGFARAHGRRRVHMSDKSNAMAYAHGLGLRTFKDVAAEFPEISGTATNSQTGYTADFSLESHELGFRNGRLYDSNTSCQLSF